MLRLLRHYLPIRKAFLILSETLLLWIVLAAAGSAHLWDATPQVIRSLARENLSPERARSVVFVSAFLLSVLAQLAIAFNELYDFRVSRSRFDRAQRFVGSMGSAMMLAIGAVLIADYGQLGRMLAFPGLSLIQKVQVLVFGLLVGFALLYAWRALYHDLLRRARFNERVLVIGAGKAAHVLAREMRDHGDAGFDVVALLPETASPDPRPARNGPFATVDPVANGTADLVLGDQAIGENGVELPAPGGGTQPGKSLLALAQSLEADVLVVALDDRRRRLPTEELLQCRLAGLSVRDYESIFEQVTGKLAVEAMRPSYLIFNEGFARHPWADLVKRAFDAVVASVMLVVLLPVLACVALAVRHSSPGPILFTQQRVGRDGRPFTLLKFRSMHADAEKTTGPVWAQKDDPRITKVGRFLRRTRLDELPQLVNVLLGDMSLVGPRPERPHFVEELAKEIPYFRQRHIVKPGLTGWAQINYPYGSSFEDALQKLQYDLFYIKYQSLLFDLSILFHTVKTILLRKGT